MKKFIITTTLVISFCSTMVAQSVHCSYFMTIHWQAWHPAMFMAQFNPADSSLTVTPVPGSFGGIVSVAVYTDLTCGTPPECVHQFSKPVTKGTVPIPSEWYDCALEAQPLFIKICWVENPVKDGDK